MELALENSFLQVPFDQVAERVANGGLMLDGIISLFQARLDLADKEVEFSTRAKRECLHEREIKQCSLERALGYFKNYHLYNSKDQALLRKAIDDEVLLPMNIISAKRATEIATQTKHIRHEEQQYAAAVDSLEKTKARHLKLIDQINAVHNKLTKRVKAEELAEIEKKKGYFLGFFGSLDPEQEREKLKKKLEKLKQEFEASRRELMMRKNLVLDTMINLDRAEENAIEIYERLERIRIEKSASSIKKFCVLERQYLESRLKHLEQLETGAVAGMNPTSDANLFVSFNKKPSETLRKSYALQILHLNHLSRDLPDDSFLEILSRNRSEGDGGSIVEPEANALIEDVSLIAETDAGTVIANLPPSPPEVAEISASADEPCRSRSATGTSVPLERPSTPDMCIQEKIVRRYLDTIFIAGTDNENGDEPSLVQPLHGSENSLLLLTPLSTPPNKSAEKTKGKKNMISFRKKRSSSHDLIFAEECNAAHLAVHSEEWRSLFADSEGRKYFLQMLDEKRGRSALLHPRGFRALTTAMQVFLDECEYVKDRTSAMRMANMGNTFHSYGYIFNIVNDDSSPKALSLFPTLIGDTEETSPNGSGDAINPFSKFEEENGFDAKSSARKMYLQREKVIRDHSIWSSNRFWEDALQHGVIAQLKLTEAVVWDELSTDELHESITAVQNIIFGQLGAMAFTMHEIGLPRDKVEQMIADLCKLAQLTYDHRKELMLSTADTFSHTSEEEKVALDNIILPTTSVVETESAIGHVPLVVHKGDKKDAVYLSETKETMDELWWSDSY